MGSGCVHIKESRAIRMWAIGAVPLGVFVPVPTTVNFCGALSGEKEDHPAAREAYMDFDCPGEEAVGSKEDYVRVVLNERLQ